VRFRVAGQPLALQCRCQGWVRWMGCGGVGEEAGRLPSLSDTIAAVRRELSAALAADQGQSAQFRAGPVELEFEIAVTCTGDGQAGVQLSVLTLDGQSAPAGGTTQRIKVTLRPPDLPPAGNGLKSSGPATAEGRLPERPARAEGLEILEVADGLMVYQADPECVHHLNNTAAIVFELCDGTNTVPEIGEQLAAVFGLDGRSAGVVEECITELWSKSIIS
jgi:Trypsin-co-occurring domain 2/Coenzyme PQQ synthesis protein D (PqqD)